MAVDVGERACDRFRIWTESGQQEEEWGQDDFMKSVIQGKFPTASVCYASIQCWRGPQRCQRGWAFLETTLHPQLSGTPAVLSTATVIQIHPGANVHPAYESWGLLRGQNPGKFKMLSAESRGILVSDFTA